MKKNQKKIMWIVLGVVLALVVVVLMFSANQVIINEQIQNAQLGLVNLKVEIVSWINSILNPKTMSLFVFPSGTVYEGDSGIIRSHFLISLGSKPVDELKIEIYKDDNYLTYLTHTFLVPVQPNNWLIYTFTWTANQAGIYTSKTYIRCTSMGCSGQWFEVTDLTNEENVLIVKPRDTCTSHYTSKCVDNSACWYDSCDNQEECNPCSSTQTCTNGVCHDTCEPGNIGNASCSENKVIQRYRNSDCSEVENIIATCQGITPKCSEGKCVADDSDCGGCPGEIPGNCINNIKTFVYYECNINTKQCESKTRNESCDSVNCVNDGDCLDNQRCSNSNCVILTCQPGDTIKNHKCNQPIDWLTWGLIGGGTLLIGIVSYFMLKNSKRRRR